MSCKCDDCKKSNCSAREQRPNEDEQRYRERQEIAAQLCRIKHKIIVLSGKGGVGKTTVAANLALALADRGKTVGLMDVDIHGPSVPRILGLEGCPLEALDGKLLPVPIGDTLKVVSVGFLLQGKDEAVIWRGPLKMGVIRQFVKDVDWGDLDYLVIDCPPGTGDEPLSVIQVIDDLDGAVIVTTPQALSTNDVRRSIQFCRHVKLPVLGVVENMSGFLCPHCGKVTDIFKSGGGEAMALDMKVPFLGRIPIDPRVVEASDQGTPYVTAFKDSETAKAFAAVIDQVIRPLEGN